MKKLALLKHYLSKVPEEVHVLFSGGNKSRLVLRLLKELGKRPRAIIFKGSIFPNLQTIAAKKYIEKEKIPFTMLRFNYLPVGPRACFNCRFLMSQIIEKKLGKVAVVDCASWSDTKNFWGLTSASKKAGFFRPLVRARITDKALLRALQKLGMPTGPGFKCLAKVFPNDYVYDIYELRKARQIYNFLLRMRVSSLDFKVLPAQKAVVFNPSASDLKFVVDKIKKFKKKFASMGYSLFLGTSRLS